MKFIDNRNRNGTFEDFGYALNAFQYEEVGKKYDGYEDVIEYGINMTNGYTLSFDDEELELMIDMVNKVKKQKQKEQMLK